MINVVLRGKPYLVLKAEADARGVTAATLARAILTNIALTDDVNYAIHGLNLNEFGKPPAKNPKARGKTRLPKFEWNGVLMGLPKIAVMCGIPYTTIRARLDRGWSLEKATTTPAMSRAESGRIGGIKRHE
ncbi:hypothetical protein [Rhizobium nepotum]|uniref:hypothetical protein n=1 Tax=Rhizobium nepotum TaxID=1035271 RepID=UPI003CF0BD99